MRATGEYFVDYEDYLRRWDFLSQVTSVDPRPDATSSLTHLQKKFSDSVSGKSGLTYFEAVESEQFCVEDIDKNFPQPLREPVLRKIQFKVVPRVDDLVNLVYEEFQKDFFPGENVIINLEVGGRKKGVIREKAKFPELKRADGNTERAAFSRYFVMLDNDANGGEALVDGDHLQRPRRVFSRKSLKPFIKNSVRRDEWPNAPWLVKEQIATDYRLPMEIPSHLMRGAYDSKKPGRKPKHYAEAQMGGGGPQYQQFQQQMPPVNFTMQQSPTSMQPQQPMPYRGHLNEFPSYAPVIACKMEQPKQAPLPIKYPTEDLDASPRRAGVTRPKIKFLSDDNTRNATAADVAASSVLQMTSVGPLLEICNTLNVHCEIFVLDSFTLDDLLDAMKFSSSTVTCELLEEVHCAVLRQIVDDKGQVQVQLPNTIEDDEEAKDVSHETSPIATPISDVNNQINGRSKRARTILTNHETRKSSKTPSDHHQRDHRAADMFGEETWIDKLKARDVANGGWQLIMVGLIYQLSKGSLRKYDKDMCNLILAHLAPLDQEATQETARQQFATMNVNLRIAALQMIVHLASMTRLVRAYLDDMASEMTDVRKRKLAAQGTKKILHERLQELDSQRKIQLPNNMTPEPKDGDQPMLDVTDMDNTLETNGTANSDNSDSDAIQSRSLRRQNDRKRKRDEEAQAKEEKAKAAKQAKEKSKQSKAFSKLLADIQSLKDQIKEEEEKITQCEQELREANVARTKVLGRDRFWNRYWWFERNGVPFEGLQDCSTSEYGYINGRLWVQGPIDMEREGYIDLSGQEERDYYARHGLTPSERKKLEEGETSVYTADEWGYYDNPESLDGLIAWLDERGHREKALRKELTAWRDPIVAQMTALKNHLTESLSKKDGSEEQTTRVSTRHKTYVDPEAANQRCLKWKNWAALNNETLGHLHSQRPEKKTKKSRKVAAVAEDSRGVAQPLVNKRTGKVVTRQGARYANL
ncbi:hypothetical protein LTR50_005030 [Elasticomyces elasticus]|nr:hypothetical protein LTR50_005030 [Elasticomyces elasticus]